MVTDRQSSLLAQDLPRDVVRTRDQAGQRLSYVDGWYAVTRANEVFGPDGWSYAVRDVREVYRGTKPGKSGGEENTVIIYEALVAVTALGITREDVGIGQCDAGIRALAQGIEKARKEAVTDGLKRALRTFGPSFGLALYDKDQRDVGLSRTALALRESLASAADPDAWSRDHADEVRSLDDDERDELRALVVQRRAETKAKPAVPSLASLGVEVQMSSTPIGTPAEAPPAPDGDAPTFGDLIASIRACATPGDVADRWVGAADDLRAWSAGEREACWAEAVQRVMALLGASKAIATQKLKAAVEARKPKGPSPKGGTPKPSAPTQTDVASTPIGQRETLPAPAALALVPEWAESFERAEHHIAGMTCARHIENAARKYRTGLPAPARELLAARLQRLSWDPHDGEITIESARELVSRWIAQGPVERVRPAARAKIAAGGVR